MNDIQSRVIKVTAQILRIEEDKISETDHFVEDLGADSTAHLEIIMAIETEFNIEIKDDDANKITSIDKAVKFIESLQQEEESEE